MKVDRSTPLAPVPRALRVVSWVVLLVSIFFVLYGAVRIGVTSDEPLHVQRLRHYLDSGWYLGDGQVVGGEPVRGMNQQYVYAPVTMLLLHAMAATIGVEGWATVAATPDAYTARHIGVALIGVAGLLAVACSARILLRRWDWALVAAALTASTPLWTGHAMFNIKDVPVASGYSLAMLGLITLARDNEQVTGWLRFGGPAVLTVGVVLGVGTRPAMWTGIVAGVLTLVLCRALSRAGAGVHAFAKSEWWCLRDLALALLLAWLVLLAVYPRVFGTPLTALWRSVHGSSTFEGGHASWLFIPEFVALEMPLLLIVLVGVGIVVGAQWLIGHGLRPRPVETRILLVASQVFAMPIGAMVTRAPLLGDLRQLLFAVPASALLATFGLAWLFTRASAGSDRQGPRLVSATACIGLMVPLISQGLLFPYNYVFFNPLATIAGVSTNADYYRASGRAIAPDVPDSGRLVCSGLIDDSGEAMRMQQLAGWDDCRMAEVSPVSAYLTSESDASKLGPANGFWLLGFNEATRTPANCRLVESLSTRSLWQEVPLAHLLWCTREFPTLNEKTTTFAMLDDLGTQALDLGWFVPEAVQGGTTVRAKGATSTLTFKLSPVFAGRSAVIVLSTSELPSANVSLAGQPLHWDLIDGSPGMRITVPRPLVDRAIRSEATLALQPRLNVPLDLELVAMQVRSVS